MVTILKKLEATLAGDTYLGFIDELLPTLDNLRNLFLAPTTEMLSFFRSL